jgi:hypothetical protein
LWVAAYVLCACERDGWHGRDWDFEGFHAPRDANVGEPDVDAAGPTGLPLMSFPRLTWISTTSDAESQVGARNVGMEFARGRAVPGATHALLRAAGQRIAVEVRSGVYWHVRWDAAEPNHDDDEIELDSLWWRVLPRRAHDRGAISGRKSFRLLAMAESARIVRSIDERRRSCSSACCGSPM